jgi:hypothetical protein
MMPRAQWPLLQHRPVIQVVLTLAHGGQRVTRTLLADTGAGGARDPFEMILDEVDCLLCGGKLSQTVHLGGAYSGSHPVYNILVEIPQLNLRRYLRAVGVPAPPPNFDGIACFRFLNRFTYGNFGNKNEFGLET